VCFDQNVLKQENYGMLFPDESATFQTLNELRERGVKVDLGFPDEMWDTPDAEVVRLKTQVRPPPPPNINFGKFMKEVSDSN
jgi:hypothetical protein